MRVTDKPKKKSKLFDIDNLNNKEYIRSIDNRMQHSSYYHKRYQGYMEKLYRDENGKKHIQRIYIGEYYTQDIEEKKRVLIRILYAVLYILAAGLFIFFSVRKTEGNLTMYVQFLSFLTIAAMFALMIFLITYIAAPKHMTAWEHYSGPARVKIFSLLSATLIASVALAVTVFVISHREIKFSSELINISGYVAASFSMFLINRIEAKIQYKKTVSENKAPRDAYYIEG